MFTGAVIFLLSAFLLLAAQSVISDEAKTEIRSNVQSAKIVTEVELVPVYLGRFSIPAVGVDVACYESSAQSVVDARDSAAYFFACGHWVIADHVNQGFGAIKRCKAGDLAMLTTSQGEKNYICVDIIQGHNTGKELTDLNYKPINDLHPDALVCYTCNGNWRNVTIVFFALELND